MIETVEGYIGNDLKINHLMEVDFEDFPKFIDSLGGVTVTAKRRVCSPPFDNFWKGLKFKKGENDLTGAKALGLRAGAQERVRPQRERPRPRRAPAAAAGRGPRPADLVRHLLPGALGGWHAPKAFKTDLHGPGLLALALDAGTGGTGDTKVLEPSCLGCGAGGSLLVSKPDARRRRRLAEERELVRGGRAVALGAVAFLRALALRAVARGL